MNPQTQLNAQTKSEGQVLLEMLPGGVALIRLGGPDERVVTLTEARINSLAEVLKKLKSERARGVIISGPTNEMFTAGADINLIAEVRDAALGEKLARMGQKVFDELAGLPCISVAAISGACVGGGCELALACTVRLISDHKSSVIGLPEIKLGILPGFGGTQRLPRIVGLPRALDIILAGKTLRPKQALAASLVNEVVATEKLLERARQIASGEKKAKAARIGLLDRFLTFTALGRKLVGGKAQKSVAKETKGFYPAPPAALQACILGLDQGMAEGLIFEAKELGRLITTSESKALLRIYFITEAAKSIGKSARKSIEHLQTVVIGSGVMGAGIAGVLARNDCSVILKDNSEQALQRGLAQIRKYLESMRYLSDQERSFILNRIEVTSGHSANIGNAGLAIEAVFENIELKKKILGDIARLMPQDALVASNTSSLSVSEIAKDIPNPERVVGMHFFNPVPKMPLVEIIRGARTSDRSIALIAALTSKMGKFPIVVKDVPGFLVNRILTPYLNEAAFMLEEYALTDIDRAAVEFGMPMGPLRLLDEVGLDVASHVSEIMQRGYGERMRGPEHTKALAQRGMLGKKSGSGFYVFSQDHSEPNPELRSLLGLKPAQTISDRRALAERLILAMVNEAVRCLDEGVAGAPGKEASQQIDLGSVMGFGFPPFRGGILHYADALGAAQITEKMRTLSRQFGARLAPAHGIVDRAQNSARFSE